MTCIAFRNNWKYKLDRDYSYPLPVSLCDDERTESGNDLIRLTKNTIEFKKGYAWDGPSGPTIDTANAMRASLVHDGLYQAMREGWLLPNERNRKAADVEFRRILKEDGMFWVRRWAWYWAVRRFAKNHALPERRKASC